MKSLRSVVFLLLWCAAPAALAAPSNFVGLNTHQPADDVLDAAKSLGVSWVRIDFNWFQVEPSKGNYNWSLMDKIIASALARGLKVFPTVGYGAAWACEPDTDGKANNNTPKVGEYQKFCQAAAARYVGKIDHWGLWNEPNLDFFEGTMQQWIDRVVIEGVKGIKAGCPGCKVLGPELASVGTVHDVWFDAAVKALKKAGLMFDIITWHNYSSFEDLEFVVPGCPTGDLFINDLEVHRSCFGVKIGSLAPYEVMKNNGIASVPLWITETGYTAAISDTKKLANQVIYYRRVLEEQLKRSWYAGTFFYEIVDDNVIKDKWGMAVRTGTSPAWPGSYQLKPVWSLVSKALAKQPAFGGTGTDCDDGLDNDGDKKIDYPADTGCASASDPTETAGTAPPDAAVAKPDAGGQADKAVLPPKDGPVPVDKTGPAKDQGKPGTDLPSGPKDGKPADDKAAAQGDSAAPPEQPGNAASGCGVAGGAGAPGGGGDLCLIFLLLLLLLPFRTRPLRKDQ